MKVQVWNDGDFDLVEEFKGDRVEIKAGEFLEMDRGDAVLFKGQYKPIEVDASGHGKPEGYKKIRIEGLYGSIPKIKNQYRCEQDGKVFNSQKELDSYIAEHYADKLEDQEFSEKFVKKTRGRRKAS